MSNTNNKWTNKNLKIGDRVMIDWNVCEWEQCSRNPVGVEGEVVVASWNVLFVRWDNGESASYNSGDSDLVLVTSENKSDSKDSWFEKGEFPPAGTTCEANHNEEWTEVYIIGMDGEGYCVYRLPKGKADTYGGRMFTTNFRPIKGLDPEVAELKNSFPNVPEETLKDIYSACKTLLEKQE